MARNAVAAKRRKQKIDPDKDLAPIWAGGYTEGVSAEEVEQQTYTPAAKRDRSYMGEEANVLGMRVPRPSFVAEEDADSIWYDHSTGRMQKNVVMTFRPETVRALQSGMICLRCLEPQAEAFPLVCDSNKWSGCSYPIRDRQIMDFAMEFEGEKHLGPAKPISEYLAEREERKERRAFHKKLVGGGSRMKGLRAKAH
jgi:hypothetical protein